MFVLEGVQERKKIVESKCGEGIRKIGELARSSPVDLGFVDKVGSGGSCVVGLSLRTGAGRLMQTFVLMRGVSGAPSWLGALC